jgi:flagellar motor switch protein FliN/FliY
MDNFNLSQEEIDALLRQMGQAKSDTPAAPTMTDADKDKLGEIANISLGSAATSLSHLLGQRVEITTPDVRFVQRSQVKVEFPRPFVVVTVSYTSGLIGVNVLILELADALKIADLMLGGDGHPQTQEIGELQLSALAEAMNQMMGGAATAMSTVFKRRIDISTPEVQIVNLSDDEPSAFGNEEWLAQVSFRFRIGTLVDSLLIQFIPYSFLREMLDAVNSASFDADSTPPASFVSENQTPPPSNSSESPLQVSRAEFADFSEEAAACGGAPQQFGPAARCPARRDGRTGPHAAPTAGAFGNRAGDGA